MPDPAFHAIRRITPDDRPAIVPLLARSWGSQYIVTRGKKVDASLLPGLICEGLTGEVLGLVTLRADGVAWELMTLDAFVSGRGIGKALFLGAADMARSSGAVRLWLITSNDNLDALGFYQKLGMRIVKVYPDAITEARDMKPEIPKVAESGIPIRDEIELSMPL